MIANPCFHRWRDAQRLMNPAKVVMHVMQRNRVFQILHFLRESVSQTGKSAHRHTHCEVLPLDVGRGNVTVIRIARNDRLARSHADCGAVASLWRVALA
jgi:hypothetical protein